MLGRWLQGAVWGWRLSERPHLKTESKDSEVGRLALLSVPCKDDRVFWCPLFFLHAGEECIGMGVKDSLGCCSETGLLTGIEPGSLLGLAVCLPIEALLLRLAFVHGLGNRTQDLVLARQALRQQNCLSQPHSDFLVMQPCFYRLTC